MRNYSFILLFLCFSCELADSLFSEEQKSTYVDQCFINYTHNYEKLLTKEDLSQLFGLEKHLIIADSILLNEKKKSHTYTWESETDTTINALNKRGYYVSIDSLTFYTDDQLKYIDKPSAKNYFDHHYQPITVQEYELLLDILSKTYSLEEDEFIKRKSFLKRRLNQELMLLEHIGDRAYWYSNEEGTITLVILKEEAVLTLTSNTSDDISESLNNAIKIAELILSKCQLKPSP